MKFISGLWGSACTRAWLAFLAPNGLCLPAQGPLGQSWQRTP